jgi:dTDP-4-amino-4,6-dideoxygalactose transaminase
MLVAHYFGLPQPMSRVRRFCDEHGIALIEDCAHAFFGESEGRGVGGWGEYAIASLTKFFPVLEGGCLVSASHSLDGFMLTRRPLVDELKALANSVEIGSLHRRFTGVNTMLRAVFGLHGALHRAPQGSAVAGVGADDEPDAPDGFKYDDTLVGTRITWTTRAIVRLVHCARIVALRRRNYALLAELLGDLPGAKALRPDLPEHAAPYVFPLCVSHPEPRYRALRAARVPLFRWDLVWPGTPRIPDDPGLAWANEIFQLGCHQDLTEAEIRAMAQTVRRVFETVA